MRRKDFIKKSAALNAIGPSSPLILKDSTSNKISTYERVIDQINFEVKPILKYYLWKFHLKLIRKSLNL